MNRVTHTGYTRQLLDEVKRLRSRAGVQFPVGKYDVFIVAATPAATYTLTTLPYWLAVLANNGVVMEEGLHYTVDNSTGVITVDTSYLASGDVLVARYLTTGELVAKTLAADTGNLLTETEAEFETGLSTNWIDPGGPPDETITRLNSGHTGSWALRMESVAGSGLDPLQARLDRDIAVTAGVSYILEGWLRSNTASSAELRIYGFSGPGGFGGGATLIDVLTVGAGVSPGLWQFSTGTVTFSSGVTYARLALVYNPGGGTPAGTTFDADDLWLSEA